MVYGSWVFTGGGAVAVHCADGCTSEPDADWLCEDSSDDAGDGKLCTWTDTAGSGAIDWKATHVGTFSCTDKGTYALSITTHADGTVRVRHDTGSEKEPMYIQFYFAIDAESLANTERSQILTTKKANFVEKIRLSIYQDGSGNLVLQVQYAMLGTLDTTVYSTKTLSLDTWYRIRIGLTDADLDVAISDWDGSNNEAVVDSVDSLDGVGSRYIDVGASGGGEGVITVQFDNIKMDDDTAITTGCTE